MPLRAQPVDCSATRREKGFAPVADEASDQFLADHIAASVDAIGSLYDEHRRSATRLQASIDRITSVIGRPGFVVVVVLGLAAWIVAAFALTPGDANQPTFLWLEISATVAALLVAMLILVTQRRQDKLADRRAQLTLELAMLADRKSAKIIALLEELRRDHPDLENRADTESAEMATPSDPEAVLAALDERRERGAGR
jgi:uncharacterized membrane protein